MMSMILHRVESHRKHRERRSEQAIPDIETWRRSRDDDGTIWLVLDRAQSRTNTLSSTILGELDRLLDRIEPDRPRALVIRSGKEHGFCAGGDIDEFAAIEDPQELTAFLERGHAVLDRLEGLPIPTIAVIHGYCLGGGLELALACDERIGLNDLKTGFPEVKIGLHPGLGGTFRAPGTVDPIQAMTMMLTGRTVYGKKNRSIGLVADLVEPRHMRAAVAAAVDGQVTAKRYRWKQRALGLEPVRRFAADRMRDRTQDKAPPEHYPAPYALLDLWQQHGKDRQRSRHEESASFGRLLQTDTARNLIRVFSLRRKMKALGAGASVVRHVHVVGAGQMGADIAGWCALQGLRTTLSDMSAEPLGAAIRRTERLCRGEHKDSIETREALDRLVPDLGNAGIAKADLIIEAVPESLEIKKKVYETVGQQMREGAILATNTSSIRLEELREHVAAPERFAGLHFFNPVAKMLVVEVVRHEATDTGTAEALQAFCTRIGKLPVPVRSYPGFLVNRALMPYLLEALVLIEEGIAKETIDQAARGFGMPMGPIELADQVGLDICLDVGRMLKASLAKPMPELPEWLEQKVENGALGKKTGQGFYRWKEGQPQKEKGAPGPTEAMTDRLMLPLLDACVECHREGVVEDPDLIDGALIFGAGFAPFRGGPIHYAGRRGMEGIIARLKDLAKEHGRRFEPDPGWAKL